jgi:hypothetical protein
MQLDKDCLATFKKTSSIYNNDPVSPEQCFELKLAKDLVQRTPKFCVKMNDNPYSNNGDHWR